VLLYYEMSNPEAFVAIPGQPGRFRHVPVFNDPGRVRLTLYDGEESLGTKTVTVVACPPDAREALELLNPPLPGKKGGSRDVFLWGSLIVGESFGLTPPLTEHEMQILREQLPVIKRHPDWAEIAEMRMARVEALYYIRQVSEDRSDGGPRLRDDVEAPEFPALVTDCMKRQTQSPFAQAIQDDLRDTSATLAYLIKDRERDRAARLSP
jgi:hypothetical protein